MPASTSGRIVRCRERLDALDERVAGIDVDAGVAVGERGRRGGDGRWSSEAGKGGAGPAAARAGRSRIERSAGDAVKCDARPILPDSKRRRPPCCRCAPARVRPRTVTEQLVFELAAPEPPSFANFLPGRNAEALRRGAGAGGGRRRGDRRAALGRAGRRQDAPAARRRRARSRRAARRRCSSRSRESCSRRIRARSRGERSSRSTASIARRPRRRRGCSRSSTACANAAGICSWRAGCRWPRCRCARTSAPGWAGASSTSSRRSPMPTSRPRLAAYAQAARLPAGGRRHRLPAGARPSRHGGAARRRWPRSTGIRSPPSGRSRSRCCGTGSSATSDLEPLSRRPRQRARTRCRSATTRLPGFAPLRRPHRQPRFRGGDAAECRVGQRHAVEERQRGNASAAAQGRDAEQAGREVGEIEQKPTKTRTSRPTPLANR